jgi:hypothetical protein
MIALALSRPRSSALYLLSGSLPRNAAWAQTLEFPAVPGMDQDLSGNTDVAFIFREFADSITSTLTVSVASGGVVVTDGNTLTINTNDISDLTRNRYWVDLVSTVGGVPTLWASGVVAVDNSLAS